MLGNAAPGNVSTPQIQAALDLGGPIRVDLGPNPSTIVVTQTLVASRATVLDGGWLFGRFRRPMTTKPRRARASFEGTCLGNGFACQRPSLAGTG